LDDKKNLKDNKKTIKYKDTDTGEAFVISVTLRPHLKLFLEQLSKSYELVCFTAAKRDYGE